MFEVAPSEMLLFAIVAIVVIGPKDLPKAMRFVGKWVGKARGMARHFRRGIDTRSRGSELEELEKQWRAQNEAIMKAYPQVDSAPPAALGSDTAPQVIEGDIAKAQPSDVRPAPSSVAPTAPAATEGEKG